MAGQPGLPPFPVWPPPSGGYPITKWETGPIPGTPFPASTFPAGHFIDGLGVVITPGPPVRTMGGGLG